MLFNFLPKSTDMEKERDMPTRKFIQQQLHRYRYTPDIYKLDQYEKQLVFIADELMKAFPLHLNFIKGTVAHATEPKATQYCGTAYTRNLFSVFKYKVPGKVSPIILPTKYHVPRSCRVKGELWLLPAYYIPFIDMYKMNGEVFQRLRVRVDVPFRELKTTEQLSSYERVDKRIKTWYNIPKDLLTEPRIESNRAWMYVAIPSYWEPLLDGGYMFSPIKIFRSRNTAIGDYFYFTRGELNCT